MINYNPIVGDCSVVGDVANVRVQEKNDGGSAFGNASSSLCQVMDFFVHCFGP
jgi:hypothetical protein